MVYSTHIDSSETFAWVMVPSKGQGSKVKVKMVEQNGLLHLTIRDPEENIKVTMPIEKISSKIELNFIDIVLLK